MISDAIAQAALAAIKDELAGGFLYLFAGPVPADADDALDIDASHTQLVMMSKDADGTTGLTFGTPVGNSLPKASDETWEGVIAFDGAQDGEGSLSATFYRFCLPGDNGRGVATGARLQGTVGGIGSGASVELEDATLTDNGSNTQGLGIFSVSLDALG